MTVKNIPRDRRKRVMPVRINHRRQDEDIAEHIAVGVRILQPRESSNDRPLRRASRKRR
jgi:hypothetical protein